MPRLLDPGGYAPAVRVAARRLIDTRGLPALTLHAIWARSRTGGVLGFLPATEDDVVDARVWLAWCELARGDDLVSPAVGHFREQQREMLDILTERSLDETGLDLLVAVIEGLNAAVCACEDPMPVERARAALARHCPPGANELSGGRTSCP